MEGRPKHTVQRLPGFVPPRPLKLVMLNGALFEPSLLDGIKQIEIEVAVNEYGRVTAAQPWTADRE